MYYKIASLIKNSSQNPSLTSEIFIAQPDANKEALAGKLFLMLEIKAKKTEALKIINFLVSNLNYNYYQNEKIILRERISSLKVEHIFETSLAKTNKDFIEFLSREKIRINLQNLNISAGIIYENSLHFTNLGKNKALLIFKEKKSKQKSLANNLGPGISYRLTDITQTSQDKQQKEKKQPSQTKIFTNVVSGIIPENGYFLFTNEALPEYLSNKQLISIITKLPVTGAAEHIKNTLSTINAYISFAGIIIKNTTGQTPSLTEIKEITNSNIDAMGSIDSLNTTEETTEKYLTPSGIINFKKWLKIFNNYFILFINFFQKKSKTSGGYSIAGNKKNLQIKDKIFLKRKPSYLSPIKILTTIKNIIIYIINIIIYILKVITDKEQLLKFLANIKLTWHSFINKLKNSITWVKNLSLKNKILFIIALTCLLLFIFSLMLTKINNEKIADEENISNLIAEIEQKQNQVDAYLLYNNEDSAKKVLKEMSMELASLPQITEEQIEQYQKFITKYNLQLEKTQHFHKIDSPSLVANFINLNSLANANNLILLDKKIYVSDSEQNTIYTLSLTDKLITAITDLNITLDRLDFPTSDKENNIYYLNNNKIIALDTENEEISSLSLELPAGQKDITNATSFNNRLYLIDTLNNQIYRLTKSAAGFTTRDNWLVDKTDLKEAVSLSIDGHVYVLKNNGEVIKLLKGQDQDFNLATLEPPLTQAKKIIVSLELEFIYIFEASTSRLAIFNKTGDFILQYKLETLTNLKDFAIDENEKKIYFLDNTSVYEIEAVHIKD